MKNVKGFLCCKCLSRVSVGEVFMHYFDKNVVSFLGRATGVLPLELARVFRPSDPPLPTLAKNPAGVHGNNYYWDLTQILPDVYLCTTRN